VALCGDQHAPGRRSTEGVSAAAPRVSRTVHALRAVPPLKEGVRNAPGTRCLALSRSDDFRLNDAGLSDEEAIIRSR
jgi:hypothetical protein